MTGRKYQQYWTREAIDSMKAPCRWVAPTTVSKPIRPHAEVVDGGCQIYRMFPVDLKLRLQMHGSAKILQFPVNRH